MFNLHYMPGQESIDEDPEDYLLRIAPMLQEAIRAEEFYELDELEEFAELRPDRVRGGD